MKIYRSILRCSIPLILVGLIFAIPSCKNGAKEKTTFCTQEDFKKLEKIDIHCHISVERHTFMDLAVADNFRILTINTDAFEHPTIEEQQEFIVCSLPNIDRVRARNLLEALNTVERVFSATKEELKSVNGIGEKISEDIRRVLTNKYTRKDTIQG